MKLRTSFFNPTVAWKNITRFRPVWALYFVYLFMVYLTIGLVGEDGGLLSSYTIPAAMGFVNFVYGAICASTLFGDLFHTRSCFALHAMPLRREGWFLTNTFSGILFCAVPNTIIAVMALPLLGKFWYLSPVWLVLSTGQFLFFFAFAIFCVMCAGRRFAMMLTYGILNFLSLILYGIGTLWFTPLLRGIIWSTTPVYAICEALCPVVKLTGAEYVIMETDDLSAYGTFLDIAPEGLITTGIFAAVGLVFLGIALLIYRRRQLECAGDFLVWKPIVPVFLLTYTFSIGAIFYLTASWFSAILGIAVGFFTGMMLLHRTVRVFRFRNFLKLGALISLLFLSMGMVKLDLPGIVRYVPDSAQVVSVQLSEGSRYNDNPTITYTQSQDIEAVTRMHKALTQLSDPASDDYNYMTQHLTYVLKDGTVVEREYTTSITPAFQDATSEIMSDWRYVLGTHDTEQFKKKLIEVEIFPQFDKETLYITMDNSGDPAEDTRLLPYNQEVSQLLDQLINGIIADCQNGTLSRLCAYDWNGAEVYTLHFTVQSAGQYRKSMMVSVPAECQNTLAAIEALFTYRQQFTP